MLSFFSSMEITICAYEFFMSCHFLNLKFILYVCVFQFLKALNNKITSSIQPEIIGWFTKIPRVSF